jgi:hypothetical protein
MLEHYKRTLVAMQVAMLLVTAVVVVVTRQLFVGMAFLATMQIGALLGALLGTGLKRLARRT